MPLPRPRTRQARVVLGLSRLIGSSSMQIVAALRPVQSFPRSLRPVPRRSIKRDNLKGCTIRFLVQVAALWERGPARERTNMAALEWKPNKSYKLGDRATIRYKGQAFLLLCMEPGWSGSTPPTILRGGSKAPGHEYDTAVVRVRDGTCVWKWKIA
jgi:hypothetical protein